MSSRLAIALLTTVTSGCPASWIFLRSTEAPMAEDPMPASQANTMLRISRVAVAVAVATPLSSAGDRRLLALVASIWAVAALRSPSSSDLSIFSSTDATTNVTAAAPKTPRVTPR